MRFQSTVTIFDNEFYFGNVIIIFREIKFVRPLSFEYVCHTYPE